MGTGKSPASAAAILSVEQATGLALPVDYKTFLGHTNGFTGFATRENYIDFYRVEDLVVNNVEYEVREWRPELFLFASNGGGEGFFFDLSTAGPNVLMIAFISNWKTDALWHGASFTDFLAKFMSDWSPFRQS